MRSNPPSIIHSSTMIFLSIDGMAACRIKSECDPCGLLAIRYIVWFMSARTMNYCLGELALTDNEEEQGKSSSDNESYDSQNQSTFYVFASLLGNMDAEDAGNGGILRLE